MTKRLIARVALAATALGGLTGAAFAPSRLQLGAGPNGETCVAEQARADGARTAGFSTLHIVRCRGFADLPVVGRMTRTRDTAVARADLAKGRASRLACGDARTLPIAGLGPTEVRQCTNPDNFRFVALTARGGRWLIAGEVLAPFFPNMLGGLRALAGAPPSAAPPTSLASVPPAPPATPRAAPLALDLAAEVREARTSNIRGEYTQADELLERVAGRRQTRSAADDFDLALEAALTASNFPDATSAEQARASLAAARRLFKDNPAVATRPLARERLQTYEALIALTTAERIVSAPPAQAAAPAAPTLETLLREPEALAELNQRARARGAVSALSTEEAAARSAAVLQAQREFVDGALLARRPGQAGAAVRLESAARSAERLCRCRITPSGVASDGPTDANVVWLASSIARERARLAEQTGGVGVAEAQYRGAYQLLGLAPDYRGSPLEVRRELEYAAYLGRRGQGDAAEAVYGRAFAKLADLGPTRAAGAIGPGDLTPYFDRLARRAATDGPDGLDATSRFFDASQYLNPSGLTRVVEQLRVEAERNDPTLRALKIAEQEARALGSLLARTSETDPDYARLRQDTEAAVAEAARLRGKASATAQYLTVNDTPPKLSELQAALRTGAEAEGYLRVLVLPTRAFGLFLTHDRARVFPIARSPADLARLAARVRRSIDGSGSGGGETADTATGFDVDAAFQLRQALLGPIDGDLAAIGSDGTLIFEPTGPLARLPMAILIDDAASVDRWARANGPKTDYSGLRFLVSRFNLVTAASPRAFLSQRARAAPRWTKSYIGFGGPSVPEADQVSVLAQRLETARCRASADGVADRYLNSAAIGTDELVTARTLLGGDPLVVGDAFSDSGIKAMDLSGYAVLHFATHGFKEGELGCDNPPGLQTSLAADSAESDGMLSYRDIGRLQLNANLVVLSACDTGAPATRLTASGSGESAEYADSAALSGLVRAFFRANARSVLITYWPIPELVNGIQPSTLLIKDFFIQANGQASVASALRRAQMARLADPRTSHPFNWGAFALVGEGSIRLLDRDTSAVADARPAGGAR
jgi:CHAT domain-containing protein